LVFLGALSNQAVIIANHGKFPVLLEDSRSRKYDEMNGMIDREHCVMTKDTRLNLLADVFDFKNEIVSVGDEAIDLGFFLIPYTFGAWLSLIFVKLNGVL
jgi:hypothetical protein